MGINVKKIICRINIEYTRLRYSSTHCSCAHVIVCQTIKRIFYFLIIRFSEYWQFIRLQSYYEPFDVLSICSWLLFLFSSFIKTVIRNRFKELTCDILYYNNMLIRLIRINVYNDCNIVYSLHQLGNAS